MTGRRSGGELGGLQVAGAGRPGRGRRSSSGPATSRRSRRPPRRRRGGALIAMVVPRTPPTSPQPADLPPAPAGTPRRRARHPVTTFGQRPTTLRPRSPGSESAPAPRATRSRGRAPTTAAPARRPDVEVGYTHLRGAVDDEIHRRPPSRRRQRRRSACRRRHRTPRAPNHPRAAGRHSCLPSLHARAALSIGANDAPNDRGRPAPARRRRFGSARGKPEGSCYRGCLAGVAEIRRVRYLFVQLGQ